MDGQQDRPLFLLTLLEARRLDDPAVDLLAFRTLKPELLALGKVLALQARRGELGELVDLWRPALVQLTQDVDVVGSSERRAREYETAIGEWLNAGRGTSGSELAGLTESRGEVWVGRALRGRLRHGQGEYLDARDVTSSEEYRLVVVRELRYSQDEYMSLRVHIWTLTAMELTVRSQCWVTVKRTSFSRS